MSQTNCRVCGRQLTAEPLLSYGDMPASAQNLPGAAELAGDRGVAMEVRQCLGCGLVQLAGEPVSNYRDVIRAAAFSGAMKDFRLKQFAAFAEKYSLAGRKVVEIGCGLGEYLSLIKQSGMQAYGLENLKSSVDYCRQSGLNVAAGFAGRADYRMAAAPFAAFFMLHFLEHLPDPGATLAGIRHNLAAGGVGLVEVPNFDMVLRRRLFAELMPDHLFYFTKETLSTALNLNGFEVLECGEVWHDYIISAVVRKREALGLADFVAQEDKLKAELAAFTGRFKKVAIWGAGHQAFALIALCGLAGRVSYVIDSAPFKQGKYTPASHVPIVAPEALRRDPVDAVIVMAGGYSDEVTGIIAREYPGAHTVAVMGDHGLEIV